MINYIFFAIGIITVFTSVFLLKKETSYNYDDEYKQSIEISNYTESIETLEELINDLNMCFSDTISEVDEKYKNHNKKFEELNLRVSKIEKNLQTTNQYNTLKDKKSNNSMLQPQDPRSKKIIDLKNTGMTEAQIAKQLNMGIGEVRLVLNIYNRN